MSRDTSKVFLNINGYTLKNIKTLSITNQDPWKQGDPDIYGNVVNEKTNDPRVEIKVGVTRGEEDELFLFNAAEAQLELPVATYKDGSGRITISGAYKNVTVSHVERDGGKSDVANYTIRMIKIQNLATK